jgi:cation transport ATPase
MKTVSSVLRNHGQRRLLVMIASGVLMVASVAAARLPGSGKAPDILMIAAVVFAGAEVAVRAWGSLRVRHVGIEVLVTIAAARAVALGECWEAAAVTFLFVFGAWLEARTLRHTRRVLGQLLVIACPGALVISTPVAVVAGIGRAARAGILIKGGEHLERAGKISALAIDKTGTLTEARPRLTDVIALRGMPPAPVVNGVPAGDRLLVWAGVAESGSEHPLAGPLVEGAKRIIAARAKNEQLPRPASFEARAGGGVLAQYDGHAIAVGNERFLHNLGVQVADGDRRRIDDLRAREKPWFFWRSTRS